MEAIALVLYYSFKMTSEFKNNIFTDIPKELPEEVFQTIIQHQNVKIARIISKGQKSEEEFWYDQEKSEWVLVLQGAAQLEFKDKVIKLKKGDYINIEAHKKHRIKWTTPDEETIWLVIFY